MSRVLRLVAFLVKMIKSSELIFLLVLVSILRVLFLTKKHFIMISILLLVLIKFNLEELKLWNIMNGENLPVLRCDQGQDVSKKDILTW